MRGAIAREVNPATAACYDGRHAVLATMHGKEKAIAPAISRVLGLTLTPASGINTDRLGTFTGEVPRKGTMRQALRAKAMLGIEATGLPLAIASEGSFGPHPSIPFLPAGREMLIFLDLEHGIEIVEEQLSEETNFAQLDITPGASLESFVATARFPSHALVFRDGARLIKGITTRSHLDHLLATAGQGARLETDMRAHVNPTRMAEIARLAERLARRIATPCPACAAPGFGVTASARGLPCAACGTATSLVQSVLSACTRCGHASSAPRADGRRNASPTECPECNP